MDSSYGVQSREKLYEIFVDFLSDFGWTAQHPEHRMDIFQNLLGTTSVLCLCFSHRNNYNISNTSILNKKYSDLHNLNKLKHREHQIVENFNRAQKLSREFK